MGRSSAKAALSADTSLPDGTVLQRSRLSEVNGVAMDLIAYASDGLAVGGLLCYPDDGQTHPAVIHVHGALQGIFDDPAEAMIQTCLDWAQLHGKVAFAPSLRGEDGGEGQPELCLGEADDVVNAATLLRSLEMVDTNRLAVVGGSLGGCVTLKAGVRIPNLRAVVAYVPPTDWAGFMTYHRTSWSATTEVRCDGSTFDWNIGGPALADTFDNIICGHPECPLEDYQARSPLPGLLSQSAPTLVMAAGADNVVPPDQEVLWSVLRSQAGHPVDIYTVNPCDPPGTPATATDVLVYVNSGHHLLSPGSISSGLLFAIQQLDGP